MRSFSVRTEGAQALSLRISGRRGKSQRAESGGMEGGNPENADQGARGRTTLRKEAVFHTWLWVGFQDNGPPDQCVQSANITLPFLICLYPRNNTQERLLLKIRSSFQQHSERWGHGKVVQGDWLDQNEAGTKDRGRSGWKQGGTRITGDECCMS